MTDYQQTLRIQATPDQLFDAITTADGLTAWWTKASGSGTTGGELAFEFNHPEPAVMHVDEATRPSTVRWTVTACGVEPDWVGTHPTFSITPAGNGASELHFRHHGLTSELDCIEQCTRGWNHYLESLRRYVEVGRGMARGSEQDLARRA
jgi:uncharacterized protein YndB with AHSA1/START domain